MTPQNATWLGVGFIAGLAVWFTQIDAPKKDACETYRVSKKIATAYVLQPPAPEHIFCESPIVQKPVEPVAAETESQKQIDETVEDNRPRRRHRHMRRHRRYW